MAVNDHQIDIVIRLELLQEDFGLDLYLAIAAAPPIACLWAPDVVARFPLAGALFTARPLSHRSSEPSVVMIGWVLLVVWFMYALFEIASTR